MKYAVAKVDDYTNLMKCLPLDDLLASVDMDQIGNSITVCTHAHTRTQHTSDYTLIVVFSIFTYLSSEDKQLLVASRSLLFIDISLKVIYI